LKVDAGACVHYSRRYEVPGGQQKRAIRELDHNTTFLRDTVMRKLSQHGFALRSFLFYAQPVQRSGPRRAMWLMSAGS
jgi:hypothetical protein